MSVAHPALSPHSPRGLVLTPLRPYSVQINVFRRQTSALDKMSDVYKVMSEHLPTLVKNINLLT